MATGSQDGVMSLWDLEEATGRLTPVKQFHHDREVAALRFFGDGVDSILTCDEAATVRIWNRNYGVVEAGPFLMGDAEVAQTGNAKYDFDLFGQIFNEGRFVSLIARSSPLVIQRIPQMTRADALESQDVKAVVEAFTAWGGEPSASLSLEAVSERQEALLQKYPENLVGAYIRWYRTSAEDRSVTPLQDIRIADYIDANLAATDIKVISQLLRLAPDHPPALARFADLYLSNDNHGDLEDRLRVARWYAAYAGGLSGDKPSELERTLAKRIESMAKSAR